MIQKLLHFQEKFPRISGLQFWKPWPKNSLKVRFSGWKIEKDEEIFFLLITIFLKTFFRGRWIQFWEPYTKNIAPTQKLLEKLFWEDCFSKKHSPGRSNFSFDTATEKTSPVGRNIFTERPKKIKQTVFLKKLLRYHKRVFRKVRLKFWQSRQKYLAWSPNLFCWRIGNDRKLVSYQWNCFFDTFLRGRRNEFLKRCRNFSAKISKPFAESPSLIEKNGFFRRKSFFFEKFHWASRMPFQQPVHAFSGKSKTILHSKWWTDEKCNFPMESARKGPPVGKKVVLKTHSKNLRE